jgi:argininosuccinate lyase
MSDTKKLWGGRFTGEADAGFAAYNRSYTFDRRLFAADARASMAHAEALRAAGVLSGEELEAITGGLRRLLERSAAEPDFFADDAAEDVHSFIESRHDAPAGAAGRTPHTRRAPAGGAYR